jgi:hypothetical protein
MCEAERVVDTRAFEISSWSVLKESMAILTSAHYIEALDDWRMKSKALVWGWSWRRVKAGDDLVAMHEERNVNFGASGRTLSIRACKAWHLSPANPGRNHPFESTKGDIKETKCRRRWHPNAMR